MQEFFTQESLDWIVCGLLFLAGLPFETVIEPRHRLFRLDNPAIAYPYVVNETVPTWLLFVLAGLLPAGLIAVLSATSPRKRTMTRQALRGLLLAFALNVFIVGMLKHLLGNQRPDFLSRCEPLPGTPKDKYVDFSVCAAKDHRRLSEGFRSSPSGHTGHSFCGLGYLTFWVGGQFGTLHTGATAAEMLATISPLVLAMFIGISRISDYKHHWYDVVFGGLIGLGTCWVAYRLYYPPITDPSTTNIDDDLPLGRNGSAV